jgi:hypothetical protein
VGSWVGERNRQRPELTISHQERPNRLGVAILYGGVVRDYRDGPRQRRPAGMALRCERSDASVVPSSSGADIFANTPVAIRGVSGRGIGGSAASLPGPSPSRAASVLRFGHFDGVHFAAAHAQKDLQFVKRPYLEYGSGEPHGLLTARAWRVSIHHLQTQLGGAGSCRRYLGYITVGYPM